MVEIQVELPTGPAAVSADWAPGDNGATVIVAHGAGTGKDHPFLTGYVDALSESGFSTLRFNFPYVEQGRRMPGPAPHAIATWNAVVAFARSADPAATESRRPRRARSITAATPKIRIAPAMASEM